MNLLLLAFALAAEPPAPTPAWQPLAEDHWGHYFLDPASVVRDRAIVRFRMRGVAVRPLPDGTMAIVTSQRLDCANATMTTTGGSLYGADGRATASREVPEAQQRPEPIAPGSAQDSARRTLCPAP